jgi:hypothetical protein
MIVEKSGPFVRIHPEDDPVPPRPPPAAAGEWEAFEAWHRKYPWYDTRHKGDRKRLRELEAETGLELL